MWLLEDIAISFNDTKAAARIFRVAAIQQSASDPELPGDRYLSPRTFLQHFRRITSGSIHAAFNSKNSFIGFDPDHGFMGGAQ